MLFLTSGFGYDFRSLRDPSNPVAQSYHTIAASSPAIVAVSLLMVLFPILEKLPLKFNKRHHEAMAIFQNTAMNIITTRQAEGRNTEDILGCIMKEKVRLETLGETGLSNDEMVAQVLVILA